METQAKQERDSCPFCGNYPYEEVDIGVGSQPVAVTCCELGQELHSNPVSPVGYAVRLLRSVLPENRQRGEQMVERFRRERGIVKSR